MIRSELVARLASEHPDLSGREIEQIVSTIFDTISERLAAGGRLELRGFGTFANRAREDRTKIHQRRAEGAAYRGVRIQQINDASSLTHDQISEAVKAAIAKNADAIANAG